MVIFHSYVSLPEGIHGDLISIYIYTYTIIYSYIYIMTYVYIYICIYEWGSLIFSDTAFVANLRGQHVTGSTCVRY